MKRCFDSNVHSKLNAFLKYIILIITGVFVSACYYIILNIQVGRFDVGWQYFSEINHKVVLTSTIFYLILSIIIAMAIRKKFKKSAIIYLITVIIFSVPIFIYYWFTRML